MKIRANPSLWEVFPNLFVLGENLLIKLNKKRVNSDTNSTFNPSQDSSVGSILTLDWEVPGSNPGKG